MLLMGPSKYLNIPDNLWIVVAGFPVMGIFQTFVFIPIIPEMLEALQHDLKIVEGQNERIDNAINDKVNDAYGFIFAFTNFVAPLTGAALHKSLEERNTFDVIALANFGFGIIFFIFNCGIFVFSENRKFNERLQELKDMGQGQETEEKAPI